MATKLEPEYALSPTNDDSDGESQNSTDAIYQEEIKPPTNNVADILKRLQSTGALIKKPKQEYRCYTCDEDFRNWEDLENHLIQHVSLPSVVLEKLPSDDEDIPFEDENWSDEEESSPPAQTTPQKIDISQILKKTGISIKKSNPEPDTSSNTALNKLSGLGFTIKKNSTPIKKEPDTEPAKSDVMQKLGNLGGIKLKLKSSGNNTNSFKVVNGLKDFKASDDEDEASGNEDEQEGNDEEHKSSDQDGSGDDNDSTDEKPDSRKKSESNDSDKYTPIQTPNNASPLKSLQGKTIAKVEPLKLALKTPPQTVIKEIPPSKPSGRPAIKQTPKRGANLPIPSRESPIPTKEPMPATTPPTPDKTEPQSTIMENVTVKKEVDPGENLSSIPLFSTQIKSERASPPPSVSSSDGKATPMLASIKSEPDTSSLQSGKPIVARNRSTSADNTSNEGSTPAIPLFPVAKVEDMSATVIEINGDSNDEDDDCCVVSATPAPDVKPIVPKTENPQPSYATPAFSTSQSSYSTSSVLSSRLSAPSSLEKQHNFNWNAPDSKPPIDMLEKSADDIFESLLSNSTKKENLSLSEASEYISLDTLGPQHSCDICNTRFTDLSLLEEHKRMTGHSRSLVAPSSSTLLPYNPSSNILSSLLPVKQLADQVGKLSAIGGSGPGFTHQQNVMINIQAYPGAGGVMGPPPPYNSYSSGQNMNSGYPQGQNNMYGPPGGNQMPGQYPGQHYMGPQSYGQFPTSMPNSSYPSTSPQFSVPPSQYSTSSPLQGMQQSVYGQSPGGMTNMQGQMGPPIGAPYVPASSPGGSIKSPNNNSVRIQNVQTFPPGQMVGMPGQPVPVSSELSSQPTAPGQMIGGQMPPPTQIRMAAGAMGPRPRMPGMRGQRPSIRPGIQVHGQVRGAKPGMRMPMKRPANMPMGANNAKKRPSMLLPDKHDNEDCTVMAMQKQREGLPMIHSVQGAKDKINLGSQISITKKTVNKEASAMANVLASRGISIKQKQKSRSPTPERPLPHIPNLGAGVSIKHSSKSSNFSIPEAKVGGGMLSCKICKKMFMNQNSLTVHMTNAHPQSKVPLFKCDECPASYPKSLQLQHHKRVFHNVSGPNRELGLPVVDLAQEENLKRLSNLGIYSFIPLANREQAGGCFGIPVISVHNMNNGSHGVTSSLQALGADGLLSLGPLKPLPKP